MKKIYSKPARVKVSKLAAAAEASEELVTPCRLLLVLIVSTVLIAGISFSVIQDDSQRDFSEDDINLTAKPFIFDWKSAMQVREDNLEVYNIAHHMWTVDRRSALSLQEFWDIYDSKWPVIITDVVKFWPAMNWTKDLFLRRYGKERIVMKAVIGELQQATGHALPLEIFIQHLPESSQNTWTYLEDEIFLMMRPELKKDIGENIYVEENFFNLFQEEIRPWDCMFLWGTAFSRSSLHLDPYNWTGISAVLSGRKKWKLFPPGQDDLLDIYPKHKCGFPLECRKYNSPVDAFAPDFEKYPKFKRTQYLEVDQLPGEMLIIPTGWFHQAFNVEETLALSTQVMNRNNYLAVLEEIIKAGNLKRKRIPPHFNTLLPPDQVKLLLSLLPKKILKQGKVVTEELLGHINRMKDLNKQQHMKEESAFNKPTNNNT